MASTFLGIELGSTRIKAALIEADGAVVATGSHAWENAHEDGTWTYALDDVWAGIRSAVAALLAVTSERGDGIGRLGGIGVSAMMHGYLALDADGEALTPFRTWRNTFTGDAAAALSLAFDRNMPLRWSASHLLHALRAGEEHVGRIATLTTLAGYTHRCLTGRSVLGVGDASGMFPIDPATGDFDATLLTAFEGLDGAARLSRPVRELLPTVLPAGEIAGSLTAEGAALLDPSGAIRPGIPLAPPEGDAGTGMVATNAVRPRIGNVSAGTSAFAMVVLEGDLPTSREEIDVVTTPAGDPVAMIHTNNCTGDLDAWVRVLGEAAALAGSPLGNDELYRLLFERALEAPADAGGLLAYNYLSGEHQTGIESGRPLLVRGQGAGLDLGTLMRAQLYGAFGALAVGMRVLLGEEGVALDRMHAHGGIFTTRGAAQQILADALDTPVAVAASAGEGGAWGMAVLVAYAAHRADGGGEDLADYLDARIFAGEAVETLAPDPEGAEGCRRWLDRYVAALPLERLAGDVVP